MLHELGERLRRAREARGWSLGDVEAKSHGRLKAGIVGCYERGDRTVSVPRLMEIARLYDVPVSVLLEGAPRQTAAASQPLIVELAALSMVPATDRAASVLANYVATVRGDRRSPATGRIVLRAEDLRAMAAVLGTDRDWLIRRWRVTGLLHRPDGDPAPGAGAPPASAPDAPQVPTAQGPQLL